MTPTPRRERVMLGIPTLTSARRSPAWIEAVATLNQPMFSSLGRFWVEDQSVATARNMICEEALRRNAEYVVFLSDDVIPIQNMVTQMLARIGGEFPDRDGVPRRVSMVTGVYWTKTYPAMPYLWQKEMEGPYLDWRVGEFFPVDLAGCDALMIEVEMLRHIERPWFSGEWTWGDGLKGPQFPTEDFYFFTKARKAGFHLFCDSALQCLHEDRKTGQMFGLTKEMYQAGGVPAGGTDALKVAEIGAGISCPTYGPNCEVVRFDARTDVRPDVRCDVRSLPEHHFGLYDAVNASHVLEHFDRFDAERLVRHWPRLLKAGGTFVVHVPNVAWAMERVLAAGVENAKAFPSTTPPATHHNQIITSDAELPWLLLYGGARHEYDIHKHGYTRDSLAALLAINPDLGEIEVIEEDDGKGLRATAVYRGNVTRAGVLDWWGEIDAAEKAPASAHANGISALGPLGTCEAKGCIAPAVTRALDRGLAVYCLEHAGALALPAGTR